MRPVITSEFWRITGQPDLGSYTTDSQEPVDFAVWQAADGRWQLWSCIRHTGCGGKTRLFYRWEGPDIAAPEWEPMGIAMEAHLKYGETPGGLQAPHVIRQDGRFLMIYGDWERICLAESLDGRSFTRILHGDDQPDLFTGPYGNTRDPMLLEVDGTYYCYYCGHEKEARPQCAVFCRTSRDVASWSVPVVVSAGGSPVASTDWYGGDCERPFVVRVGDRFCLFRNQSYGANALNTQYISPDPLDFGVDDDRYLVGTLPVAAPEIVEHAGAHYIVALTPTLDGMQAARLEFAG